MMKCLHNSIDFFNNETMKSLILGYFKGKGKMQNVLPSISWDSKKWISFINRSFLDVYGVKLAALSRSHSDRDEFRLQTTVVTPFH